LLERGGGTIVPFPVLGKEIVPFSEFFDFFQDFFNFVDFSKLCFKVAQIQGVCIFEGA
jgi:hypothetical protein